MALTCPDGHRSESTDYCDVCGLALTEVAGADQDTTSPGMAPVEATTQDCPHCGATNPLDALFCEACGYDYTTGTMPRPVEPTPFPEPVSREPVSSEPVSSEPMSSEPLSLEPKATTPEVAGPPAASVMTGDAGPAPALDEAWVAEIWIDPDWYADQGSADRLPSPGLPTVVVIRHTSSLIGRLSRSRGIVPDLDISGDPGVSRRHAQLTTDGSRWFVEDLGSANGTYVGSSTAGLPKEPLASGQKREIASDERLYVGAWTRIVIRKAADGEA